MIAGEHRIHAFYRAARGAGRLRDLDRGVNRNSEAKSVNNLGQVVGNQEHNAFIGTARGGIVDLGTLPGGRTATAWDINDYGGITNSSINAAGNLHAFYAGYRPPPGQTEWVDLGALPRLNISAGSGVNNRHALSTGDGPESVIADLAQQLSTTGLRVISTSSTSFDVPLADDEDEEISSGFTSPKGADGVLDDGGELWIKNENPGLTVFLSGASVPNEGCEYEY